MIEIIYYKIENGKEITLGEEFFTRSEEVIIPKLEEKNITITKKFKNNEVFRWEVKDSAIKKEKEIIKILLSERFENIECFYLDYVYKSNKSILTSINKGTLVEVDFGYLKSLNKKNKKNKHLEANKYFDNIQKGEISKRRLCIVISIGLNTLRVLPLTSNPNNNFKISERTLSSLSSYNKESYIIPEMVTTVSFSRILFPESFDRRTGTSFRNIKHLKRISNSEIKKMERSLNESFDFKFLSKELENNKNEMEEIKKKKKSLLKENKILYKMLKISMDIKNKEDEKCLKDMIKESKSNYDF